MTEFERMVSDVWVDRIKEQVQQMIGTTLGPALAELNRLTDKVGELERRLSGTVNFMEVAPFPAQEEEDDFKGFTGGD